MHTENGNICIACGQMLPGEALISIENMPVSAQDIPDENQVKEDKSVKLKLFQCDNCGLVQFDCNPVNYYKDVIRSGGFSTTMVELRKRQYNHLINTYGLQGKKFLEVGCGQGEFLKVLEEFDVTAFGIEHRDALVEKAKKSGLHVWKDFALDSSTKLQDPYGAGKYDVFLSFNFLEHQPYPKDMLGCIYEHLSDDAMGLITVPSLEYILVHDGYYELIRDHLAYYTFETLEELLINSGFEVLEKELINRDTLSVIVRKKRGTTENSSKREIKRVDVSGLKKSIDIIQDEVIQLKDRLNRKKQNLAIWGASHQGFTLAATTELKQFARYIIDSAPFKQGKYAPASHLPIVAPDYFEKNPVDVILIVAPGYTDEIADVIRNKFGKKVDILVLKSEHIEKYE